MKLRKIHIDGYKNLATDFSFEDADKYIALIGLNGSGKSNLLEVISLLFGHVMGIDVNFPFSQYSLMYDIRGHSVDITEDKLKDASITSNDLPSSLIACYSGEDSRLWNSGFKEYYVHFFNAAIGGGDYKPQVLYVNKYCWKIAFISLLFSENNDIKKFILEKLHIDADTITIQVKTKDGVKLQKNDASNWYQRIVTKFGNTEMSINDLKDDEDVQLLCEKYPSFTDDQIIFYYLYFLHIPDKRVTIGLQADKIIESIGISLNGFSFDDLSEGEKKLILVECITKVLGDENSLILLDQYREKLLKTYEKQPINHAKVEASRIEVIDNYICFVQLGADTSCLKNADEDTLVSFCQNQNEQALDILEKKLYAMKGF